MDVATTPNTPALAALRQAGRKFARAQASRDAALDELRDALRAAHKEGQASVNALIEASGVARQTVYDALKGKAR